MVKDDEDDLFQRWLRRWRSWMDLVVTEASWLDMSGQWKWRRGHSSQFSLFDEPLVFHSLYFGIPPCRPGAFADGPPPCRLIQRVNVDDRVWMRFR